MREDVSRSYVILNKLMLGDPSRSLQAHSKLILNLRRGENLEQNFRRRSGQTAEKLAVGSEIGARGCDA